MTAAPPGFLLRASWALHRIGPIHPSPTIGLAARFRIHPVNVAGEGLATFWHRVGPGPGELAPSNRTNWFYPSTPIPRIFG